MTAKKRRRRDSRRKPGRRHAQARRPAPATAPPPEAPKRSSLLPSLLAPLAAGRGSVALGSRFFIEWDQPRRTPPPMDAAAPAAPTPGQPPDLSSMTPRQAAIRLFNRIMMADEQGRPEEAQRFVPMALAAYGQLPRLDAVAHYHLGRIHAVAGDFASIPAEIDAIRRLAPNHLLATVLEHLLAEAAGDMEAMARAYATFAADYEAEMAAGRPEYRHHQITIEQFRIASTGAVPGVQVSED